jgi:hypothetical protein
MVWADCSSLDPLGQWFLWCCAWRSVFSLACAHTLPVACLYHLGVLIRTSNNGIDTCNVLGHHTVYRLSPIDGVVCSCLCMCMCTYVRELCICTFALHAIGAFIYAMNNGSFEDWSAIDVYEVPFDYVMPFAKIDSQFLV